jgi:hypothetical protein
MVDDTRALFSYRELSRAICSPAYSVCERNFENQRDYLLLPGAP